MRMAMRVLDVCRSWEDDTTCGLTCYSWGALVGVVENFDELNISSGWVLLELCFGELKFDDRGVVI